MGRVKHEKKFSDRKLCSDSLANAVSVSSKLLDSADISDKLSESIFLFYQKNTSKLIKETKCLQSQKKGLIKELFAANERLEKAEEINRKLTAEAERLRMNLEAIREVLKDSDIDKAKERLAQLEDSSWMRTPTPIRTRRSRVQHSAGSLLDSDNASSGGSDTENQDPDVPVSIRRSARLSKDVDIPYIDSLKTPSSRKRPTSDDAEGYHDVSFKKLAIDQTNLDDNELSSDDSHSVGRRSGTFRTPEPPKLKVFTENRLTRLHDFHPISALRLGMCSCCGKRFTFGRPALRCRICRLVVHVQCQHQLKQRCVPPADLPLFNSPRTPNTVFNSPMTPATLHRLRGGGGPSPLTPTTPSTLKRQLYPWHTLRLDALCPTNESPRIPAAVILCVNEVASRGFIQLGIYRVPGGEKKVQDLLDKFLYSRTTPSLALVEDIHVVCSCLKAFLRLLDEPLVTLRLRPEFVAAGELFHSDPESAKYRAAELIKRLPTANRDTLAFLMLHLKDVARSKACKMGEANLAKVFGLTIVGHSSVEPPLALASSEIQSQQATVRLLIEVPDGVYSAIVD
ncbi:hypothetical protein ACTXT7_012165 [Hymenolepis weldensis]